MPDLTEETAATLTDDNEMLRAALTAANATIRDLTAAMGRCSREIGHARRHLAEAEAAILGQDGPLSGASGFVVLRDAPDGTFVFAGFHVDLPGAREATAQLGREFAVYAIHPIPAASTAGSRHQPT